MYPADLVNPMKSELTQAGFQELLTPEAVSETLNQEGTTLYVINSVCGCSAGTARPGVLESLKDTVSLPTRTVTSFAGFDNEAVKEVRKHLMPYPPSSPSIALFKDGKLVHMIERHMIEGRTAEMIAANLKQAYQAYC